MWFMGYGKTHIDLLINGGCIDDSVNHIPLPMLPAAIYIMLWPIRQGRCQCDIPKLMMYAPGWEKKDLPADTDWPAFITEAMTGGIKIVGSPQTGQPYQLGSTSYMKKQWMI